VNLNAENQQVIKALFPRLKDKENLEVFEVDLQATGLRGQM